MRILLSDERRAVSEREVRIDVEVEVIPHQPADVGEGDDRRTPPAFLIARLVERVMKWPDGKVVYVVTVVGPLITPSGLPHRAERASDHWNDRPEHASGTNALAHVPDYVRALLVGRDHLLGALA